MERGSKLFLYAWACVALAAEVHLVARGWGELQMLALVAFAGAAILTALTSWALSAVLTLAYVFPVVIGVTHGEYVPYFVCLWMAALLGVLVHDGLRTPWRLPHRWRASLACWALVVAIGTPVVLARELDFSPALLDWPGIVWSSAEGSPGPVGSVVWVLHVALIANLGILWFDWLFQLDARAFRRRIVLPLVASAGVMSAVAAYQLFFDIGFLNQTTFNQTIFGGTGRATGTLFDANLCGIIATFWLGGALLLASRPGAGPAQRALAGGVATLSGLAVWASGSRTAFVATALVAAFALAGFAIERRRHRRRLLGPLAAVAVLVAVLATAGAMAGARSHVVGPVARLRQGLSAAGPTPIAAFLTEQLWDRNRYGTVATAMIQKYPWFGFGVGSFQIIMPDFSRPSGGFLPSDNAQNWYRQQIVELGVVGSLGWAAWVLAFGADLLRRRRDHLDRLRLWTARGILLAFGAVSFVGVPGQDFAVTLTFWTFAYWWALEADEDVHADRPITRPLRPIAWGLVLAVTAVFAVGTGAFAATRLRVPNRALEAGWPYAYGFYDPEPGQTGEIYRWAARRAVTVVDAPTRWVQMRFFSDLPDLAAAPVEVKIWLDGALVVHERLASRDLITRAFFVRRVEPRALVETSVSRVVAPTRADPRERGLRMTWNFLTSAPPDLSSPSDARGATPPARP